jgi:ectoine hydroxylase-related dioxygenase (phytanoyl-CoA dioxygenase family)
MSEVKTKLVSDEEIRTLREDGVVALRGVFDVSWIELLRGGFEDAMASPGPFSKDYAPEGQGKFFTDHTMFQRLESFRRFIFDSPAAELAAQLMGSRKINLYDDHLLVKEPGTETPTYWHHDQPYFRIAGRDLTSLWIPLDPVTEATGAMRFAVGSHLWGKSYRPIRIGAGDEIEAAGEMDGPVPDIDADPARYPTVSYDLDVGDCVAFHGMTLHAARGNPSLKTRRRALSLRLAGDDITWHKRAFSPQNWEPEGLVEGGPIDCDLFPRLWPRM